MRRKIAQLQVFSTKAEAINNKPSSVFPLFEGDNYIGSGSENEVSINDILVLPKHVKLTLAEGENAIENLVGGNVYKVVNDKYKTMLKQNKEYDLSEGQKFMINDIEFRLLTNVLDEPYDPDDSGKKSVSRATKSPSRTTSPMRAPVSPRHTRDLPPTSPLRIPVKGKTTPIQDTLAEIHNNMPRDGKGVPGRREMYQPFGSNALNNQPFFKTNIPRLDPPTSPRAATTNSESIFSKFTKSPAKNSIPPTATTEAEPKAVFLTAGSTAPTFEKDTPCFGEYASQGTPNTKEIVQENKPSPVKSAPIIIEEKKESGSKTASLDPSNFYEKKFKKKSLDPTPPATLDVPQSHKVTEMASDGKTMIVQLQKSRSPILEDTTLSRPPVMEPAPVSPTPPIPEDKPFVVATGSKKNSPVQMVPEEETKPSTVIEEEKPLKDKKKKELREDRAEEALASAEGEKLGRKTKRVKKNQDEAPAPTPELPIIIPEVEKPKVEEENLKEKSAPTAMVDEKAEEKPPQQEDKKPEETEKPKEKSRKKFMVPFLKMEEVPKEATMDKKEKSTKMIPEVLPENSEGQSEKPKRGKKGSSKEKLASITIDLEEKAEEKTKKVTKKKKKDSETETPAETKPAEGEDVPSPKEKKATKGKGKAPVKNKVSEDVEETKHETNPEGVKEILKPAKKPKAKKTQAEPAEASAEPKKQIKKPKVPKQLEVEVKGEEAIDEEDDDGDEKWEGDGERYLDDGITPQITKDTVRSMKKSRYIIAASGFLIGEEKENLILAMGGTFVTQRHDEFNILVMKDVIRTVKLLKAINIGVPIVTYQWLEDSLAENVFKDPEDYFVSGTELEKTYGIVLKESVEVALENKETEDLFENYAFFLAKDVHPTYEDLTLLVESGGGNNILKAPPKKFHEDVIVILKSSADPLYEKLEAMGYNIYSSELVLSASLKQNLDLENEAFLLRKE